MKIAIKPSGNNAIIMIESETRERLMLSWIIKHKDFGHIADQLITAGAILNEKNET